jgi:HAD superfamily hydrolase (TIGR01509 family)
LKLKAVIIDMDGTITRFNLDYRAARQRALDELERNGLRTPEMSTEVSLYVLLDKMKASMERDRFLALRSTCYSYFEEMELKAAKGVTLYPGATETLQELRSRSLKLGLVTNNSRAGTNLTLSRLNLIGLFDAVVTRDDSDEMKPAAAPILKILAALYVSPEESILVGDGVIDILAAKAAGVLCAAVTPDPFPIQRTLKAEPDYLLGSVNDLPTLIDMLNA